MSRKKKTVDENDLDFFEVEELDNKMMAGPEGQCEEGEGPPRDDPDGLPEPHPYQN